MLIEKIFPAVVAEKSTLLKCLFAEGEKRGLSNEDTEAIVAIVPKTLIETGAFLDKMTGLWRYEFGVPYDIAKNLVWGTRDKNRDTSLIYCLQIIRCVLIVARCQRSHVQ